MRTSGRHLLNIINDILDVSRLEAGRLQLESVDFSLDRLMEELASLLHPMAADRGLALAIDTHPELPPFLRGDAMRLRQVLLNLASNAIKFTPRGSVRIWVLPAPSQPRRVGLLFEVEDTGIGIAPDQLANLFSSRRRTSPRRASTVAAGSGWPSAAASRRRCRAR